jgi:hypothetical protein
MGHDLKDGIFGMGVLAGEDAQTKGGEQE